MGEHHEAAGEELPEAETATDPGRRAFRHEPHDDRHQDERNRKAGERGDQRRLQHLLPQTGPLNDTPALRRDR
jgi:hypothetical protein